MDRWESEGGERRARAVTPAVGAVLMIVGTIALMLVVAPFVFSVAQDSGDSAPNVDFAFAYSEEVDGSTEDSFGNTAGDANADGLLTITLEGGSTLDPTQVRVDTSGSGGALTAGPYSDGDRVRIGDELTVWITRGESVDILWESDAGDESQILGRFTMAGVSDLPPWVPDPDRGCEYIEKQVPGDVTVDGVIVRCDLDQYNIDDIDIINDGAVIGEVEGDGEITIVDGATYAGDVVAGADGSDGDIDIGSGSTVNGEVVANNDGDVDMDGSSRVEGSVTAGGEVDLDGGSSVTGRVEGDDLTVTGDSLIGRQVTATGDVDVDAASTVSGDVTADGEVDLAGDSEIRGDITATNSSDGEVTVTDDAVVDGTITASEDIDVDSDSSIGGGVTADGDVDLAGNSEIGGDITTTNGSSGEVTIGSSLVDGTVTADSDIDVDGSTIVGHANPGGDLSCSSSTINGQSCDEYTAPTYEVRIDGTNSPVEEGDTLEVDVTVENTGFDDGDQIVTLVIGGSQRDSADLDIDGGDATTHTFEWTTSSGDAGNYTANVSSDDGFATEAVEVATTLPPEFSTLKVTLTKVTGGGEVNKVEFEYSIDRGDATTTTTFELEKGGTVQDSATRSGDGETWEWNHNKVSPPMTLRADISGSECYEIQIPGSASQGDTYDILADGSTC